MVSLYRVVGWFHCTEWWAKFTVQNCGAKFTVQSCGLNSLHRIVGRIRYTQLWAEFTAQSYFIVAQIELNNQANNSKNYLK